MRRTRTSYDASGRVGAWQATLAGRDDSGWSPVRQRVSWTESDMGVQMGDLAPWSDEPLVEGASRRSGTGHPLGSLGSGNGVSGIDAHVTDHETLPWSVSVRSRVAASTLGRGRASTLFGAGPFRAGVAASQGRPALAIGGIGVDAEDAHLDASMIAGDAGWGMHGAISAHAGSAKHSIEVRKVDRGLDHDGLPKGWSGATHAQARSLWRGDESSASVSGDVGEDSSGRRRTRAFGELSHDWRGVEARLRTRWTRSPTSESYRATPGLARSLGHFRPWFEVAIPSEGSAVPSLGAAWRGRDLRADASVSRMDDDSWSWRVSSSLGRERSFGSSRLEIGLSGGESSVERGEGSWVASW